MLQQRKVSWFAHLAQFAIRNTWRGRDETRMTFEGKELKQVNLVTTATRRGVSLFLEALFKEFVLAIFVVVLFERAMKRSPCLTKYRSLFYRYFFFLILFYFLRLFFVDGKGRNIFNFASCAHRAITETLCSCITMNIRASLNVE